MPFTPEQIAKMQQKEKSLAPALRRDAHTNYCEGYFHVTLNVRDEAPVLGFLRGCAGVKDGEENAPRVVLSKLGEKVKERWEACATFYPDVELVEFQIMPEHVHCLLYLKPGNRKHLGRFINGFMIGCTHGYWDVMGIPWREMTEAMGSARAHKGWQDADHTRSYRGPALFMRGYNDVEAVTPEEVETKKRYIRENPMRRQLKGLNRDVFTIVRNQHSSNWTVDRVENAIRNDYYLRRDEARCEEAIRIVKKRLNRYSPSVCSSSDFSNKNNSVEGFSRLFLDYVGCKDILYAKEKVSLICHRKDAKMFDVQKEAVLRAARSGAVVVSAFISEKEREIRKILLMEQLPIIEIVDNGFADRHKPTGGAFYACAEKRLMQISCWMYEYQKEVRVSREMCLVMNALARLISGKPDQWWQ